MGLSQSGSAGNVAAARFTALVDTERHHVYRLISRLLGGEDGAEDVLQDVFAKAWLNWEHVSQLDRPGAWLSRVAINAARQRIRRQRLWQAWFRRATPPSPITEDAPSDERVRTAIASLAHTDREVLVLRYLEELEVEQVAALLDLSRAAVDARLSRARRRLGVRLGERDA